MTKYNCYMALENGIHSNLQEDCLGTNATPPKATPPKACMLTWVFGCF